jgi:hypothetical protein
MKLIKDIIFKGKAEPALIFPGEGKVHNLGRAMHPQRLKAGGGVGTFGPAVEAVKVEAARFHPFQGGPVVALLFFQVRRPLAGRKEADLHPADAGRPDPESASSVAEINRAQSDLRPHFGPPSLFRKTADSGGKVRVSMWDLP